MRKHKVTLSLIAVLSLIALGGCNSGQSTSTSGVVDSSTTSSTDSESSETTTTTTTDSSSDGEGETEDPSDGLIDPSESPWTSNVTSMMEAYLGGGILPFVDLGEGEIDADYIQNDSQLNYRSYLQLVGGNYLESKLKDAVEVYRDHGWEALMVGEKFYASSDLLNIEVEVYRNESGLFEMRAFYLEPFDPTAVSAWDSKTSVMIQEHFGRFAVPFVYLGTIHYEATITQEGALEVLGGTWNDDVLSEFRTAFANWTITDDEESLTTLHASFVSGENTVSATLEKYNTKAKLTVTLAEAFDSTNQNAWASSVKDKMNRTLNQNELPYVYLGSVYPEVATALSNERRLVLLGNLWDDSILQAAKTAFAADGWEDQSSDSAAIFTKTVAHDELEVQIQKNADGRPQLTAERTELYDESTSTAYPDNITTAFQTKYGESMDVIPYLYLGTSSPILNDELASKHEVDVMKLVITGGRYDARILENFKAKFTEDAGWYSAVENSVSDSGSKYDEFGDVLAVAIKSFETYTYKVGLFTLGSEGEETVYLEINRSDNTSSSTAWSQPTLDNFKTVLGDDVTIPFFDIGRSTLEAVLGETGGLNLQFIADATTFSYRVYSVIYALTKDHWTVSLAHNDTYYDNEAWIDAIHATKVFNGKTVKIDVSLRSSSYYRFSMSGSISLDETYDASKETGEWSQNIQDTVSNKYGIELPYIYLGTDLPYVYEDADEGVFRIVGNAISKDLYLNAREVLTAAGFTINLSESYGDYRVVATKENEDGNIVTVVLDYENDHPYLELNLVEVFNPGTTTDWDETTKNELTTNLPPDISVPYMYLGSANPVSSVETVNDVKKISIVGGNWNDQVLSLAKTSLEAKGWPTSLVTGGWDGDYLVSYQLKDDNTAVRLKLFENDDEKIQLDVYYDMVPTTPSTDTASWDVFPDYYGDSVTDAIRDNLDGQTLTTFVPTAIVPDEDSTFYISTPYGSYSNKYVTLTASNTYITPYYFYSAMSNLEDAGYTLSFTPFYEDEMPGFTAEKEDVNGTFKIQFNYHNGSFDSDKNGWKMTALYLPPFSKYDSVTSWTESDAATITDSLDGLSLPYVNLGCDSIRINGRTGEVTITGYNYSDTLLENIKTAYVQDGWTMNDSYIIDNGVAMKCLTGYREENGHIYVVNVTYTMSATTVQTKIEVQMA